MNLIKLNKYKRIQKGKLMKATLCFLLHDNEILLAMKKRGFAVGKWNGVGGKVNDNESIESAAIRETREEIRVKLVNIKKVALLNFYHAKSDMGGMQVTVFMSDKWLGEPVETEEMSPRWFNINEIPYEKMWEDDKVWLPKILDGKYIAGDFLFDDKQNLLEYEINE